MHRMLLLLAGSLAGLFVMSVKAAKIGDPAPPLAIKQWIKGGPVDVHDGKKVYVIEFWATWCAPCRTSIPHISELQAKFRDQGVVFVCISDESPEVVKGFVDAVGKQMDFTVACDTEGRTKKAYFSAYRLHGIPMAFIVNKEGHVLWHGHPTADLEHTLEEVVGGGFSETTAENRDEAQLMIARFLKLSAEGSAEAKPLGEKVLELLKDDGRALAMMAFEVVATPQIPNRDFTFAETALARAEKTAGTPKDYAKAVKALIRFESGHVDEGLKLIEEAIAMAENTADKDQYKAFKHIMRARRDEVTKEAKTD